MFRRIVTVGHELTDNTRSGLIDGLLKLVLAHPLERLATATVEAMTQATQGNQREATTHIQLGFDVLTAENL